MKYGLKLRWGAALAVLAAGPAGYGQTDTPANSGPRVLLVSAGPASAGLAAAGEIVREIDDPHTGVRWLLTRDSEHPGGPGRLPPVPLSPMSDIRIAQRPGEPGRDPVRPVIQAGDRLIVEENTAVVEARLEAVALGTAVTGSTLDVRLKIGGRVVRAVALAAGRAALANEARP